MHTISVQMCVCITVVLHMFVHRGNRTIMPNYATVVRDWGAAAVTDAQVLKLGAKQIAFWISLTNEPSAAPPPARRQCHKN